MKITKSSFIENYKKKVSDISNIGNMDEAIHHAFKLTETCGPEAVSDNQSWAYSI